MLYDHINAGSSSVLILPSHYLFVCLYLSNNTFISKSKWKNYVCLLKLWMHGHACMQDFELHLQYSIFIFITFEFCVCEIAFMADRKCWSVRLCFETHTISWNKNYHSRSNRDADDDRLVFIFSDSLHSVQKLFLFNFRDVQCAIAHTAPPTQHRVQFISWMPWVCARELEITQGVSERDRRRLNLTMCERRICWNCLCGTAQTRHSYYVLHIYYVMNFVVVVVLLAAWCIWCRLDAVMIIYYYCYEEALRSETFMCRKKIYMTK